LLAAVDIFVILDNVQYQRRGWIHRNKFTKINSQLDWLTLPILKSSRNETKISDVQLRQPFNMLQLISPFEVSADISEIEEIWPSILNPGSNLLNYLELLIRSTGDYLGFRPNIIRASQINSNEHLLGEARIVEICKSLGAKKYLNSPGGRSLYKEESFNRFGIELSFLPDYNGSRLNSMEQILKLNVNELKSEIFANL
jgi:hypothetical protein